jgi:hypothetical protein
MDVTQAICGRIIDNGIRIHGFIRESIVRSQFLKEMNIPATPITILSDCQTALDIAENPSNYRNAKHINILFEIIFNKAKLMSSIFPPKAKPRIVSRNHSDLSIIKNVLNYSVYRILMTRIKWSRIRVYFKI